jgi:hypothetical protein
MKMLRTLFLLSILPSAGCATLSSDASSVGKATSLTIRVPNQPPELRAENRTESPGPGHIWVAGYWDYVGGQHTWRGGRWVAPMPGYEYVRARYEQDGTSWILYAPHWKKRHGSPRLARNP